MASPSYTEGPVNNPKELTVLWYFEPDIVDEETFDPYKYTPDKTEKGVADSHWAPNKYFWPKLMNDWVGNYWGKKAEILFEISFKEADKLLQDAEKNDKPQSHSLVLWVSNIDNPKKNVDGGWFAVHKNETEKDEMRKSVLSDNGKNLNVPQESKLYKLDHYFFNSGDLLYKNIFNILKEEKKDAKSSYSGDRVVELINNSKDFKFNNLFKYYIKFTDGGINIGDHQYKDLYLVGRVVKKEIKTGVFQNCVVVLVAVRKNWLWGIASAMLRGIHWFFRFLGVHAWIESEYEYQIKPPTIDGPDGPGGGGGMPPSP